MYLNLNMIEYQVIFKIKYSKKYLQNIPKSDISVKKFRMKILKIIIDTINRYSKLRDFSLSFVLS